ncbi:uncharacterized protein LOC134195179 [Corticium candelabrum]|uniref:uncharacterized protein LOC134195179 n=1 Tax=Corticium candelabrum TaxID=121492 RepID=UPI002E270FD0|nr:uncharacterized protein LOC134195179 [Corticium candelabrum]
MSQHEFVIAIRIWLGIPLFPFPPPSLKCVCGQVLDPFGNHLVSCGHGPLRIKCHDALCKVIYQALLTNNKHVKRERCSGFDNSRPGDTFHPDFLLDRPSFFDVTIANSLQPSFIITAAINAGAAAEACKDFCHADRVTAAGGIFYPLAVETLGLWTPYSLKILRSIASRISAVSHMTFSKSLNNLSLVHNIDVDINNRNKSHSSVDVGVNIKGCRRR